MTVIGREGSSPGKQGFKIVVTPDNHFTGFMGYPINSEIPVEIAVSIAAQVVVVKNGVK